MTTAASETMGCFAFGEGVRDKSALIAAGTDTEVEVTVEGEGGRGKRKEDRGNLRWVALFGVS